GFRTASTTGGLWSVIHYTPATAAGPLLIPPPLSRLCRSGHQSPTAICSGIGVLPTQAVLEAQGSQSTADQQQQTGDHADIASGEASCCQLLRVCLGSRGDVAGLV